MHELRNPSANTEQKTYALGHHNLIQYAYACDAWMAWCRIRGSVRKIWPKSQYLWMGGPCRTFYMIQSCAGLRWDKPEPCQIHTSREEVAPYSPQGHFDLTEENCAPSPSVVVSLITTVIANFRVNFSLLQERAVCEWGLALTRVWTINSGRMLFFRESPLTYFTQGDIGYFDTLRMSSFCRILG